LMKKNIYPIPKDAININIIEVICAILPV